MCGIAGIVNIGGSAPDPAQLDRLTDALAHRGPDARGTSIGGNVGLGHRRLAILDLTDAGAQPMRTPDGRFTLVFNGEIYNFEQERTRLEREGVQFSSRSDTEVLLRMFEREGVACVARLRGMFAFAVHDREQQTLTLARDRVGKKPLKYFRSGATFAFASELKALRTLPACPRATDWEAVYHFLTMMYLPAPLTGVTGIRKLPAAHILTLDCRSGEERLERYWHPDYAPDEGPSQVEWEEELLALLRESVRLRMVADVPVGAFLSGGVDSAAVVALMAQQSSMPIRTFSIGSDDPAFNELPDAQVVAQAFGTEHHPLPLTADIVHLLPELVRTYEEPYADVSAIPTFLLARQTRSSVTVALNGDGGDEAFAGYVRYPIVAFSERWRRMPQVFHSVARVGTRLFHALARSTLSYRCDRFEASIGLPLAQRSLQYLSYFTEDEKRGLYAEAFGAHFSRTDDWYAASAVDALMWAGGPVEQVMSMDFTHYLADDLLPKVDLGTMAVGLEARSPLLDHLFLERALRVPLRFKLQGRRRKVLFKEMLRNVLPPAVLGRRKRGFRLPLDRWFRQDLTEFVRDRLLRDGPLQYIFDRTQIERFLKGYFGSRVDYSDHVWALLWLEEWLRQYS